MGGRLGVPFREAERAATASTRKYKGRQRAGRWAGVRVGTRWVCRAPKKTVKKRLKNGILRGIFCGPSAPQVQKFQWPKTRLAQVYVKVEGERFLFAVKFWTPWALLRTPVAKNYYFTKNRNLFMVSIGKSSQLISS